MDIDMTQLTTDQFLEKGQDIFLYKINNHIPFTQKELEKWAWDGFNVVDTRVQFLSHSYFSVYEIENKFFKIDWINKNHEYYYNQPVEVKKVKKYFIDWEEQK